MKKATTATTVITPAMTKEVATKLAKGLKAGTKNKEQVSLVLNASIEAWITTKDFST